MTAPVFTRTPVISVTDNRGLIVRTLNWNRTIAGEDATLRVTHSLAADDSLTVAARDPRLFAAWQSHTATGVSLTTYGSLAGQSLRRDSTDSGQNVTVYDAEGRPAWARDPAGTVMQWAYDELGRPLSTLQQPAGTTETVTAATFVYGDNDALTPAPQDNNLGGICVRQYDEGGLLTTGSVALSGAVLSTSQTFLLDAESLPDWPDDNTGQSALLESAVYPTTVQADALGRTRSQTDASGHTVSMAYDVSGVPVTQSLALKDQAATTLLTGMTLSAAGQVLSETAGNGVTTTYSYEDDTLRLSGIAAVRNSDSVVLQSLGYAYDAVGNVTSATDGTVSRGWFRNQATAGARTFTYDALYQLISATGRENAANGAQGSALPAAMSLNDSQYVNYTRNYVYDGSGNLVTLTHTGSVSSTMTMVTDTLSNRSIRQNNDGCLTPETVVWADWFTPGGQLKTLQTEGGKPASGYTDSADPLAWDRNTRLQGVTLVSRSSTDATQNDREVYQYRGGMRVRKQTRTLTNSTSGLWTVSEVRYLPGLELRNSWQETVTNGSSSAPDYQEQLEVVSTQAGRSQVRALHWVSGLPSGLSNDQIRYGVDDNIGSLSLELDGSGQLISREEYYPFGGTAVWAARSETEAGYKVIRYSGQERDVTGLYYYGYRYYAPWLCCWTASDPAGEIDGLNLFCMVRNNPVSARDIAGLALDQATKSQLEAKAQAYFKAGHGFSKVEASLMPEFMKKGGGESEIYTLLVASQRLVMAAGRATAPAPSSASSSGAAGATAAPAFTEAQLTGIQAIYSTNVGARFINMSARWLSASESRRSNYPIPKHPKGVGGEARAEYQRSHPDQSLMTKLENIIAASSVMMESSKKTVDLLNAALNNPQKKTDLYYRGTIATPEIENLKAGDIIKTGFFMSVSESEKAAIKFSTGQYNLGAPGVGVLYHVVGKPNIAKFGEVKEKEYIFKTSTKFKFDGITQKAGIKVYSFTQVTEGKPTSWLWR